MRRLLLLLPLVLILALPAGASAATTGVNVSLLDAAGNPSVTGAAGDGARGWQDLDASGARTVRAFVPWNGIGGAAIDRYVAFARKARAHGMAVELDVTGSAGAMATPRAYAAAIRRLARRLRGSVLGYEIWNEPDGPQFWRGGAHPAAYAALLKAAFRAVRRADRRAKVAVGGLIANDYGFLRALYRHGAKGHFDAVAVHTDIACNTTDPAQYYREPSGRIGRYAFTGYRELRRLMLAHGDRKPIWMSELGWSTWPGACSTAAGPGGVAPAVQATYLTRAYRCLASDRYVTEGLWFDLHDYAPDAGVPVGHFGLIDDAFGRKLAFAAFQNARGLGRMRCGGVLDARRPTVHFVRPAQGTRYFRGLPVRVSASDDRGVKDINLYLDGRYIPLRARLHGRRASLQTLLWARIAASVGFGPHRLEARARDEARNWGSTSLTIVRVGGGRFTTRIASRLHVRYGAVRHGAVAVHGRVTFAGGVLGEGSVVVRFEHRVGGTWRLAHTHHRGVHRPFAFRVPVARPGAWRVRAAFVPAGPFTRASAPTHVFSVG